jgi:hypothetical protein
LKHCRISILRTEFGISQFQFALEQEKHQCLDTIEKKFREKQNLSLGKSKSQTRKKEGKQKTATTAASHLVQRSENGETEREREREIVENPSCVILSPPPFTVYRERSKLNMLH